MAHLLDKPLEFVVERNARSGRGGRGGGRGGFRAANRASSSPLSSRRKSGGRAPSGRRVYVGNLDFGVGWKELKDHFKAAGEVAHADVIRDSAGASKGCGLVEFAHPGHADHAIATLNDSILMGRAIFVREDREDGSAGGSGSAPSGGAGGGGTRVFVGNLPWSVTWEQLKDGFRQFGDVSYARVAETDDGRSAGWGIVEFASAKGASKCIANKLVIDGREVSLRYDREGRPTGGSGAVRGPSGGSGGFRGAPGSGGARGGSGFTAASNRVYVGNLAWSTTWQQLKDYFKTAGEVRHADIFVQRDGRSAGCGLVEFASRAGAERAIATLNDTTLDDRMLYVREDREESVTGASQGGSNIVKPTAAGSIGGRSDKRVFVGNMPFHVTAEHLQAEFSKVGRVTSVELATKPDGTSKGYAVVTFARAADAMAAIDDYTGALMDKRPLSVHLDRS